MLKETSLSGMRRLGISKESRALVNRGRGNDELAPAEDLFRDFQVSKKESEKRLGAGSAEAHNEAFLRCGYERRFRAQVTRDPKALARLEQLAQTARDEDLYLVCYEGPSKACHRRILLRMAEEAFWVTVSVDGVEPRSGDSDVES